MISHHFACLAPNIYFNITSHAFLLIILFSQVNKAVIAVPAKFSQLQRQATAEAYRNAGLKVRLCQIYTRCRLSATNPVAHGHLSFTLHVR